LTIDDQFELAHRFVVLDHFVAFLLIRCRCINTNRLRADCNRDFTNLYPKRKVDLVQFFTLFSFVEQHQKLNKIH
jgi:hypothetical protein